MPELKSTFWRREEVREREEVVIKSLWREGGG